MDYEKLFKRAKAYGEKMGLGSEAEDFAQECLVKAFEVGPISLEYMWLNYRNFHRADKRILSGPCGQLSGFRTVSLDAPIDSSDKDSAKLSDFVGGAEPDVGSRAELRCFKEIVESLNGRWRTIVELTIEGSTKKEIAEELNVTESRVSQLTRGLSLNELLFIYKITPKPQREWVITNAVTSGKSSSSVFKARLAEQRNRRKLERYRQDGEISSHEYIQKTKREVESRIDSERAINDAVGRLYERSIKRAG